MCLSTLHARVYHPAGSPLLPLQLSDWLSAALALPCEHGCRLCGPRCDLCVQKQHQSISQSFFFALNFFFRLSLDGFLSLLASNCQSPGLPWGWLLPASAALNSVNSSISQIFSTAILTHTFFNYACHLYEPRSLR